MNRFHAAILAASMLAAAPTASFAVPEHVTSGRVVKPRPQPAARQHKVVLTDQSGAPIGADARVAVARDLAEAGRAGDDPLLLVGSAPLGGPKDRPALFVQIQSARQCGSAGCNTSVHLFRANRWQRVVDTVSGPIVVDTRRHGGMRDLIVNGNDRWVWNGAGYENSRPAPPVPASLQKKRVARQTG